MGSWPHRFDGAPYPHWMELSRRQHGFDFRWGRKPDYELTFLRKHGRFILTGSHQPQLHETISQSLAGRTAMLTLWPFSLSELRHYPSDRNPFDLVCSGFFPRLHEEKLNPRRFFNGYLQTYVERYVRALVQLRDPLRGHLYENLIIADIMKSGLNCGIRPEIYFFRDSHGNEIDLLLRENGELTPIEIKSAATYTDDFIKKLEWFQTLGIQRLKSGVVLYNGEKLHIPEGVASPFR